MCEHNNDDTHLTRMNLNVQEIKLENVKYTKDLLYLRKDNMLYFLDEKGKPLENGAKELIKNGRIECYGKNEVNTCNIQTYKTKNYFGIIIDTSESITKIKENIKNMLLQLKEKILKSKIQIISITESNYIANLPVVEAIQLISDIFKNTIIKILICKGTLQYVPEHKRDDLFKELHESVIGGHKGLKKTLLKYRDRFYYNGMKEDIRLRILSCLNCQLKKIFRNKTRQPMVLTNTARNVFERVHIDIYGPLRKSDQGYQFILTIQDHLLRFLLGVPLITITTEDVAEAFLRRFICLFGCPRYLISDRGKQFVSKLMNQVAKRLKIKKIQTCSYAPFGNSNLERSHGCLGNYLRQFTNKFENWQDYVELAMFNYNTNIHEAHNLSPYEVVFGAMAKLPSNEPLHEYEKLPTYKGYLIELVTRLNNIRKIAYDNLVKSKERSKYYFDKKLNEQKFVVGEKVYLDFGEMRAKSEDKSSGPYEIIQIFEKNNIKISNENGTMTVHADRLRKANV